MSIFEPTFSVGEIIAGQVAHKFKQKSRSAERERRAILASVTVPNDLGGYVPAVAEARRKRREAEQLEPLTDEAFILRNRQRLKFAFTEPPTKLQSAGRPRRGRARLKRKYLRVRGLPPERGLNIAYSVNGQRDAADPSLVLFDGSESKTISLRGKRIRVAAEHLQSNRRAEIAAVMQRAST